MPNPFAQASAPESALSRYRLLSPLAGVRVSPLCLGAMNFGNAWQGFMGACDQNTVNGLLDYFYENVSPPYQIWRLLSVFVPRAAMRTSY